MPASVSSVIRDAIIVAVVVIILLIFFLPDRKHESPMQSGGSTYGRILVDSPEVYTRERMVNDRFRQEAWLLEQLKKLTDEKPGNQGAVAQQTSRKRNAGVSLGPSDAQATDSIAVADAETGQREPEAAQPQLTPIESFRGHQSVREEVRNALIENQLDDRHDLGGNTLYRLKFDATIIPGNDTSAWAQINVRFKRNEASEDEEERELKELYRRWMNDLREQVNTTYSEEVLKTTVDDKTNPRLYQALLSKYSINTGYASTKDGWKVMPYMQDRQCMTLLLGLESGIDEIKEDQTLVMQGYSPERFECLMKAAPEILGCEKDSCRQQLVREDVMGKVLDAFGTTLGQKEGVRKELKKQSRSKSSSYSSTPRLTSVQPPSSQLFVSFLAAPDLNSILVEEYISKIFALPEKLNDSERNLFNASQSSNIHYAIPIELNDSERKAFHAYNNNSNSDDQILATWTADLACEFVPIYVADREYKICKSTFDELQSFSSQDIDNAGTPSIDVKISNDYDGLPFLEASDKKILETWAAVMNCPMTSSIYVAQREFKICDSWIEEYKDLVMAKDTEDGKLSIDAKIESDYDGLPLVVVKVGYSKFRQKLKESERNKFLFSYAVTPRESSQQLASSSRLAVAEQIRASAFGGADGTGIEAGAGRSSLFSEYAQILERRPVVVGIASHPDESSLDSTENKSAQLGWLIGPKLTVGPDGLTTYRHLPSQNSLSALVSAPSWWRRAVIEIESGWLDNEGAIIGVPAKISYPIALPGDQEEITSALLLGGKRPAPSVESIEPMRVKVGEEAKLLIEGQNLWRSTVVTIGAQRSKRIFVLPNMKGIIAEFDPIDAQQTRPAKQDSTTAVRVWTSEGVALWEGISIDAGGEK